MKTIDERLEELTKKISSDEFRKSYGLGNEVDFHVFDYDPEDETQEGYMLGIVEDREYDGTPLVNASIEVETGVEDETITFKDVYAEIVDPMDDGDVLVDEDGNPLPREVEITGTAVAGDGTKLGNYAYYNAVDDMTYPLDDTRFWDGLLTAADEDEEDE